MKKILSVLLASTMIFSGLAMADQGPREKLTRGFVNIITAPIEFPKQARAYWITGAEKTPHILVWIFSGTVWGIIEGIKRAGSGLWDVVSFPVDKPEGFEPLFKPSYVFDQWPRNPKSGW